MKKTISIQISGILFHVDDDAYEKLNQYLRSIHEHFASYADSEEIVSDIERRIAEQFSEKLTKSKQVIMKKDVEKLIESMGTVKDFAEFESEAEHVEREESEEANDSEDAEEETEWRRPFGGRTSGRGPKRLFRDTENRVLAGVCAGLAAYFNVDPVIVRVVFALLTVISHGIGIPLYIILWIAMPEAKTPTQRMEMQGEPMTLSRLEENLHQKTKSYELKNFKSIHASGAIRLRVREGKTFAVSTRAAQRDLRRLDMHVSNGQLRIGRSDLPWFKYMFQGFKHVSVDVTMPELTELEISGASRADVDGFSGKDLRVRSTGASQVRMTTHSKHVKAETSGASYITLFGSGESLDLRVTGASQGNAGHFYVKDAYVQASGACKADVWATKKIEGHVTGASQLTYYGSPVTKVNVSGGSQMKQRKKNATPPSESAASDETENRSEDDQPDPHYYKEAAYDDSQTYTTDPFARKIEHVVKAIVFGILWIIGAILTLASILGITTLIYVTIMLVKTDAALTIPFLANQYQTAPFTYIAMGIVFVAAMVPLALIYFAGRALKRINRPYNVGRGFGTLFGWSIMAALVIGFFAPVLPIFPANVPQYALSKTIDVRDFRGIVDNDNDVLSIRQGSGFSVVVHGTEPDINRLNAKVGDDGFLQLQHESQGGSHCLFCSWQPMEIDITMPVLRSISLNGVTRADVQGFGSGSLMVSTAGASLLRLYGSGSSLSVRTQGVSRVEAGNFLVPEADVHLSGVSRADIFASDRITGDVSGVSRLRYYHDPSINVKRDGVARIIHMD